MREPAAADLALANSAVQSTLLCFGSVDVVGCFTSSIPPCWLSHSAGRGVLTTETWPAWWAASGADRAHLWLLLAPQRHSARVQRRGSAIHARMWGHFCAAALHKKGEPQRASLPNAMRNNFSLAPCIQQTSENVSLNAARAASLASFVCG